MRIHKKRHRLAIIVALLLTASCAQPKTTMLSTWKDDSYSKDIKRVLVLGVSENPGTRRVFEQEFSNQLRPHGVTALPSNQILPADAVLDKETILSKIADQNIDAVLVTTLVERKTEKVYFPGWYDSYRNSYGRVFKDEIVNLETSLYDVETEKMVWSALSETVLMEGEGVYKEIRAFIKIMVDNLAKEKLI